MLDRDRLLNSTQEAKNTVGIVWSAYRSVLSKEGKLSYVSTAITSGKRFLAAQTEAGPEGLSKDSLFKDVITPNIAAGIAHAKEITKSDDRPVVAPAIFEARSQRWSQDEYMAMWLGMIEENVGRIYMGPDWNLSNGGAEEYLLAVMMALGFRKRWDIEIYAGNKPLSLEDGLEQLCEGLSVYEKYGQKAPVIANCVSGIAKAWQMQFHPEIMHDLPMDWNRSFTENVSGTRMKRVLDSAAHLLSPYGLDTSVSPGTGAARSKEAIPENIVLVEVKKD